MVFGQKDDTGVRKLTMPQFSDTNILNASEGFIADTNVGLHYLRTKLSAYNKTRVSTI